ncbi:MAG TPA: cobalamin-independent methionine synthase II family protein [Trebonia sp.]|jgi:5-methyltetrahydropteroyltriglutamate--homocysteine methyltransferase|nr:cobalamin-independent methionine synthase II family protein [Trebonia sp.]
MERIGATHAGSLIRPAPLLALLSSVDHGQASTDGREYRAALGRAVDYVVRRQVETGLDVIDDGEMGKATWITYLYERTTGLESRPLTGTFSTMLPASRDRQHFPGAYAELDRLEHDATARIRDEADEANATAGVIEAEPAAPSVWVCTGPMTYDRSAIDRDLANFKAALAAHGRDITEAFLPVVAPASAYWLTNEHYQTDEEFVYALADVLHEEYAAIVESGAFLQVDDAVLMHEADTMLSRGESYEDYKKWARLRVDALNHALRGLPEDRIRYHICFGSWHGPHAYDPPLRDAIDLVLAVNAKYYLMEQANPRHEHEWKIWQDVELPDGKVLIPGVVTHHTNVVEHPELVAQRLTRLANVVGRDRVMAGTDCGFAQGAFMHRVHEEIQWAKLASLVEGARIASRELWGHKADI